MEKLNELVSLARCAQADDWSGQVVKPQDILAIAEAFRALAQRAEAAEARASNLNDGWLNAIAERDEARAKLAELEKQEPYGYVHNVCNPPGSGVAASIFKEENRHYGRPVFARPASAISLAELVPDGWKLVPVEPTKEMVAAGQDKFEECIDSGFDSCEDGSTYEYSKISSDAPYLVYIAMLAAAPEVE